jgi:lipocalin
MSHSRSFSFQLLKRLTFSYEKQYVPNASKPGELTVHFEFDAPYWVLELGPVNSNNQYDYAIVSDNLSAYLFVLARDVAVFRSKYDSLVLSHLSTMGFGGATKPVKTYHESDCVYDSK